MNREQLKKIITEEISNSDLRAARREEILTENLKKVAMDLLKQMVPTIKEQIQDAIMIKVEEFIASKIGQLGATPGVEPAAGSTMEEDNKSQTS